MTIDTIRQICRALPDTTEDIKWGSDLVFSVGGKMYLVVCLDPPHTVAFKCTREEFAELVERDGIIPAPYLARAMWVQEQKIGDTLERPELERLVRTSYELVKSKLPKNRLPRQTSRGVRRTASAKATAVRRSSVGQPRTRRRKPTTTSKPRRR
jgi:predicted DNA-binding protein (MmcQ/YjbR family)